MSIQVTLNIFSGRPNPTWLLSDAQEQDLMDQLNAITTPTLTKPSGTLGRLGYRGFMLRRSHESHHGAFNLLVHEGIVDHGQTELNRIVDNRDLEKWLLSTMPADGKDEPILDIVTADLTRGSFDADAFFAATTTVSSCPPCNAEDTPLYNPNMWNVPAVQPYNNCYNYANNRITNTFAQPGRAHHQQYQRFTCPDVNQAAQADGLVNTPDFAHHLGAGEGWYVALVIWPGTDFHWYRQDRNGCWSHKPGQSAVRNVDNSGHIITDPRTADRGTYTNFCTYMITTRNVIIR